MQNRRVGLWLIGARGSIAATLVTGLAALRQGSAGTIGLVTALEPYHDIGLADFEDIVVGGHEIRNNHLAFEARKLWTISRSVSPELIENAESFYGEVDGRIRPGTTIGVGQRIAELSEISELFKFESPREAISRLKADLVEFALKERLTRMVVINVASTEPTPTTLIPDSFQEVERTLNDIDRCALPASSLYFLAAAEAGASYINFTPSLGASPKPLQEYGVNCGISYAGCDGKSGETLLKSVIAPMFAERNLEVSSWVGHNILGNMDGWVLDDPNNKAPKIQSKDQVLNSILGYSPETHVSIEYIKSLGDWKTAWNHIHFNGFLDTPMTLQVTWQGADSILAAPLVLDLFRFVERAQRDGEVGLLTWLSCFFKRPQGMVPQDFSSQVLMLKKWATSKKV
jgi:myo-inositol-1-phosphate synthase